MVALMTRCEEEEDMANGPLTRNENNGMLRRRKREKLRIDDVVPADVGVDRVCFRKSERKKC